MRATEFVTEVFQPSKFKKNDWEWEMQYDDVAMASFRIGGHVFYWTASTQSNPTKWTIQFRIDRRGSIGPDADLFGMTGTGNEIEVMSTVVDITRTFLQQYGDKVEELAFSSKEDSRTRLYMRMVKRLLPTWDLYTRPDKENGGLEFHLTDPRAYDKPENKLI